MRLIAGPPDPGDPPAPLWRRLAWFAAIAAASCIAYGFIAWLLRAPFGPG